MKTYFVIVLAGAAISTLSACGGGSSSTSSIVEDRPPVQVPGGQALQISRTVSGTSSIKTNNPTGVMPVLGRPSGGGSSGEFVIGSEKITLTSGRFEVEFDQFYEVFRDDQGAEYLIESSDNTGDYFARIQVTDDTLAGVVSFEDGFGHTVSSVVAPFDASPPIFRSGQATYEGAILIIAQKADVDTIEELFGIVTLDVNFAESRSSGQIEFQNFDGDRIGFAEDRRNSQQRDDFGNLSFFDDSSPGQAPGFGFSGFTGARLTVFGEEFPIRGRFEGRVSGNDGTELAGSFGAEDDASQSSSKELVLVGGGVLIATAGRPER